MDKPIAWYDPTNGMVSTDKDSLLFTPLGQVLPLYPQSEQDWIERERAVGYREGHMAALAQRTWIGLTNDEVNNIAAGCHLGNSVQDAIFRAEQIIKEKNT